MLHGTVAHSGKELVVRMQIRSRTDLVNECPCFRARRDGIICAHALAVGLQVLSPIKAAASAAPASAAAPPKKVATPLSPDWPKIVETADEKSIPAEFHLIFSPDLASAWGKNSLLLGIEVESNGERKMLAAFKGTQLFVEARDAILIRYLQTLSPEKVPASLNLPGEDFLNLLGHITGHPRVGLGRKSLIEISYLPIRPALMLKGEKVVANWSKDAIPLIGENRAWAVQKGRIHPVAPGLPKEMFEIFHQGHRLEAAWMAKRADRLEDWFEIDEKVLAQIPQLQTPQIALEIEGSLNHQEARLFFIYGETHHPRHPAGSSIYQWRHQRRGSGKSGHCNPRKPGFCLKKHGNLGFEG
jgi:hypothetical protein